MDDKLINNDPEKTAQLSWFDKEMSRREFLKWWGATLVTIGAFQLISIFPRKLFAGDCDPCPYQCTTGCNEGCTQQCVACDSGCIKCISDCISCTQGCTDNFGCTGQDTNCPSECTSCTVGCTHSYTGCQEFFGCTGCDLCTGCFGALPGEQSGPQPIPPGPVTI